jgi:hypothetical protein
MNFLLTSFKHLINFFSKYSQMPYEFIKNFLEFSYLLLSAVLNSYELLLNVLGTLYNLLSNSQQTYFELLYLILRVRSIITKVIILFQAGILEIRHLNQNFHLKIFVKWFLNFQPETRHQFEIQALLFNLTKAWGQIKQGILTEWKASIRLTSMC